MKNKYILIVFFLLGLTSLKASNWKATGGLVTPGAGLYVVGEASVGENINVVNNIQNTVFCDLHSFDLGNSENPTDVEGSDIEGIKFYLCQNPASESIKIQSNTISFPNLEIFSSRGEKFYQKNTLESDLVTISNWNNGIHFLKITTCEGLTYRAKFIKN